MTSVLTLLLLVNNTLTYLKLHQLTINISILHYYHSQLIGGGGKHLVNRFAATVASYYITTLEFSEIFRTTHSLKT